MANQPPEAARRSEHYNMPQSPLILVYKSNDALSLNPAPSKFSGSYVRRRIERKVSNGIPKRYTINRTRPGAVRNLYRLVHPIYQRHPFASSMQQSTNTALTELQALRTALRRGSPDVELDAVICTLAAVSSVPASMVVVAKSAVLYQHTALRCLP
ncbi:hypothetical protein BDV95DRAFT_558428 [Massariosphaeria phaeospora]|uniref:Uncharacterized protein n=1 Tax=Massariosphaeria phaeospora TaxID=100035 RepID=A0A7C8II08_9PLEO|nr:hypothetical protein BDV95DRAFT_558428 [Massariosphaeria phaeospora]